MHVLDVNGIFKIKVRFCGCSVSRGATGSAPYIQLIRARLFPATAKIPQTAFTFRALTLASHLNNQGKLTGYDFYHSLMHLTDNAEIDPPKVRSLPRVLTLINDLNTTLLGCTEAI